ncbi:MAG: hypothetical protein RIE73_22635 [Coleofasciculus sp. C1-SOL-03]|jgi:Spy/CpxP family protein refolding chaperone|uniref:Spy/CpxP family protein refolding chaperone n=1 Tax=Coleofasciculus sp. C1-SOL-03 TaxID=3069522 RepID=UPI0032FD9F0A
MMNIKVFPLFATIAAITLAASPLAAFAQPPFAEELNLTAEQQAQLEQIRDNKHSQIEQILTPEQQEQFQQLREQRQRHRQGMRALNLTETQRNQMREIHQSAREQMRDVLTEEQQEQIRQMRGNRRGRRRMGRPNQPQ